VLPNEKDFKDLCEQHLSMRSAQKALKDLYGISRHESFILAKKFNCWIPNKSGKGINKPRKDKTKLEDILNGFYPNYKTFTLKNRLFEEKIKEEKCEECNITEWNGKKIKFELHHLDGNKRNHKLENLKVLCPNCHSQTPTYCRKNNVL